MATPTTRDELKEYCLRNLGKPVIQINADDTQLEDRLDEAIQIFHENHYHGSQRTYLEKTVTQTDLDNEYFIIDESILTVISIFPVTTMLNVDNIFDMAYIQNNFGTPMSHAGLGGDMGLTNLGVSNQYMNMIDDFLNGQATLRFNRHVNRIFVDVDWSDRFKVDDKVLFEVYTLVDPETYTDVYNDTWLKKYVTALFKKQWGSNLKKFGNVTLPSGVVLDGQQKFDEAIQEIESLEEELKLKYSYPPGFFVG